MKLIEANPKVCEVKVNSSVSLAYKVALKKGPAICTIQRVQSKSFIIPAGYKSLQKDNIFSGFVPKSFTFGLVKSAPFNGGFKKKQFNFQYFNISSLGITMNGEAIPLKPIQLSFGANARFVEAFYTQFSDTGKMYCNPGNSISQEEFAKGSAVYTFNT